MSVEPDDLETRPSLLVRVRDASDNEAWRRFVGVYGRLILADCRRRGLKWDEAEDVAQQVLTRVFQSLRSFEYRPDRGRFRDWLGTVVRNEVRRYQKRHQPRSAVEFLRMDDLADNDPAWNEAFARHILAVALQECRPHFEPRTWNVFEGVWIHRKTPSQVAQEFEVPLDWVYVAKSRVLKRVSAIVEELTNDLPLPS
ncbi:sigma-70 family RNA polymerase sigma factor [Tautonia rosea]|uniref:sigma-70 family RNA polymerase sigma factor n=1 Tax=Tautonia rosea TaxID=2728037 RepID=UPI00147489F6|nr:sigma-70 family RNA polymerase sigma factor [Tautonia rosea]